MYRQIIIPENTQLLLQLPSEFVGKQVEVIAFTIKDFSAQDISPEESQRQRLIDEAIEFYKKNAVDFSKVKKWKREDLYD